MKIKPQLSNIKALVGFSVALFALILFLSIFIIVPKIDSLLESQHTKDIKTELALEAALFKSFVEQKRSIIQDLSAYPSLTSAVMLSNVNDESIYGILENTVIGGEKSNLILQDIESNILIRTGNRSQGNYTKDQLWISNILNGKTPYHFQLLSQNKRLITYKVSVPVIYNSNIEGVLSSEITSSLQDIFVTQALNKNVAFRLSQGSVIIETETSHIGVIREDTIKLPDSDVTFTYITDNALINEGKKSLEETTLTVLLLSFVISFLLFSTFSYLSLLKNDDISKLKFSISTTYLIPILVILIGISASITAYFMTDNQLKTTVNNKLVSKSKQAIRSIQKNIDVNLQILDATKAFYDASDNVTRQEFKTFTSPLLAQQNIIQALEWAPIVHHEKRRDYVRRAQSNGVDNFVIKELNKLGNSINALERPYYYPVYYVEPMLINSKALGYDLGSNDKRLSAINEAKISGFKTATRPISLIQGDIRKSGILIFNPIYKQQRSNIEPTLVGLVLLVLKLEELIEDAILEKDHELSIHVEDVLDPNQHENIYGTSPDVVAFDRSEVISIAGRKWKVTTYTTQQQSATQWTPWLILISGIILSSIISLGIVYLIHRREVVEKLVARRTSQLQASEEQHRAVVENAVDGLLTIDEQGHIERFNQAAQHIFGYTEEEVIGKNIKILMPNPYHKEHDGYLKNYRDTGVKKIIGIGRYVEGQRKDGSIFPIDLSVSEMEFGSNKKFSGIVRDISERVALEQEREALVETLTRSNEELERFAFVCSHDLQEPLRMIRSFSEKLQNHIADYLENDEKGKKYFRFVIDGAERSQILITDILAYSSISNDTKNLEKIDITNIISAIKKNIANADNVKRSHITYDPLPTINANKTQMFQLFNNIINNSLKYQENDNTPVIHIGVEESNDSFIFNITDNGIGIEPRHFTKIFDVFQRLHRRSKYAGTGIGLSICKKIVERHGGNIWVESEKGIGSTFYIKLLKPTLEED